MQVSDQIIKVLDHLSNKIGITIDWSQQNVMPQLKDFRLRYIKYKTYSSIMWLIIGIVIFTICVYLIVHTTKQLRQETIDTDDDIYTFVFTLSFVIGLFSIICILKQINMLIKINTIPEECIINYIKNLIPSK